MPPTPWGQEPRWQNKADESSQPRKGALRLNVRRHNSAECSGRAGDEPSSLEPGGRLGTTLCIPRQSPAAVSCPGTTFCRARPHPVGSCLKTPPQRCCKFSRAKLEMLLCCQTLDRSLRACGLETNTRSSDDHRKVTGAGDSPMQRTRGTLHGLSARGMARRGSTVAEGTQRDHRLPLGDCYRPKPCCVSWPPNCSD